MFKKLNDATKYCFHLNQNKEIKELLLSFLEIEKLEQVQSLTSTNIIKLNENFPKSFHGRHYFKKGGENYFLIDVYSFQESIYELPIMVFHVLKDNFKDIEEDMFFVYRKNNKVKLIKENTITFNKKDTFGYNEIVIEADPEITTKELLDVIKKQFNKISPSKPINYGHEIVIKIKEFKGEEKS